MRDIIKADISYKQQKEPATELRGARSGGFDIYKKWKTVDDVEKNIAGLPEEVKKILRVQPETAEEKEDRFWKEMFRKPDLKETVREIVQNKKIAKTFLSDRLFGFLFQSGWRGRMIPDSDKPGMRLEGQWAERLKRGEKENFIEEEIFKFMNGFWRSGEAPYASAKELKEYQAGFNEEGERLASRRAKMTAAETDLALKITAENKKRAKERMAEELRKMQSDKRKDELSVQYSDNERKRNANRDNLENAKFIEELFKQLKSKLSAADYAEIWLDAINGIHNNRIREAAFRGAMAYFDEMENYIEASDGGLAPQEAKGKKIKMLAGQFANTLEQLRHAKEMGRDAEASAEHARFILRAILQLLEKQKI